jgi:hypothetical protein
LTHYVWGVGTVVGTVVLLTLTRGGGAVGDMGCVSGKMLVSVEGKLGCVLVY